MKDINRGALRVTEAARAQHETAVAQAVSKTLIKEECPIDDVVTADSIVRALGVFLVTGIYVRNALQSYVKTWASLSDTKDIKTEWLHNDTCQGLAKQILVD
jgi:hypothetical protein